MLGQEIRDIKNIKGIVIDGEELKSIQFADDMNIFSAFDQSSVNSTLSTLSCFEAV